MVILACGTAYHAGLIGRYLLEEWARLPAESDIASEWRYRRPVIDEHTLVIAVSQSGETIDTIAAMKEARDRGGHVLAVTNIMGSQMTRECDSVLYTRAGLEIGVAASKTFTAQVDADVPAGAEAGPGARARSTPTGPRSCSPRCAPCPSWRSGRSIAAT